ncbi:MAG: hypothetical protein WAN03_04565 [Candidatus Sulfotelmatobacter sp.]
MGDIRIIDQRREERRSEVRCPADLALIVWGIQNRGEQFVQEARAQDISLSGALLTGIEADLRSGDVIGILCAGKKARFQVIWVRYDGTGDKMQVAVHRLQDDPCPWVELLETAPKQTSLAPAPAEQDENRP